MDINDILDMENRVAHLIDGIREVLGKAVSAAPSHAHIVSKSPLCAIVPLSQCAKGNDFTPEYHIPELQSQAVVGRLEHCNTIAALADAVEGMMESGKIEGVQGRTVRLNDATLDVLRNSEVGRFVVDRFLRKVASIKAELPVGMLLLWKDSSAYRAFGEDAMVIVDICGLALRRYGDTPMCRFTERFYELTLGQLHKCGKSAAICDEVESEFHPGEKRREVVYVSTPDDP